MNERITYCMPSRCPLSADCRRYEDDAARHSLQRTYADFSEELVRPAGGPVNCPFFVEKAGASVIRYRSTFPGHDNPPP